MRFSSPAVPDRGGLELAFALATLAAQALQLEPYLREAGLRSPSSGAGARRLR